MGQHSTKVMSRLRSGTVLSPPHQTGSDNALQQRRELLAFRFSKRHIHTTAPCFSLKYTHARPFPSIPGGLMTKTWVLFFLPQTFDVFVRRYVFITRSDGAPLFSITTPTHTPTQLTQGI